MQVKKNVGVGFNSSQVHSISWYAASSRQVTSLPTFLMGARNSISLPGHLLRLFLRKCIILSGPLFGSSPGTCVANL